MKHLLNRDTLFKMNEAFVLSKDNVVFIHHPVTEDVVKVRVAKVQKDKILVSVLEGSPYAGQPDWWVTKIKVIGIA